MTFQELRSLVSGFQPAKLLLVALDLGVFDCLEAREKTGEELAGELSLDPRASTIALNALVAFGFLEKAGERYRNAEASRRLLVRDAPDYRGDALRHLHVTWRDWDGLERAWRTGRSARGGEDHPLSLGEGPRQFILGMENATRELAPRLADLLPLAGCRKALDLGGGPGNYALAFARRWPGLEVVHFDLPAASAVAREFLARGDGGGHITFREGDFLQDPLGDGYDFVWASQIIHALAEGEVRELVARISGALVKGGRVGVHDQFLDPDGTSPRVPALFGVHMLVVTGKGRTYSFEEVEGWFREAGMAPEGRLDYGGASRVLLARKV